MYLLDTHVLIWAFANPKKLQEKTRQLLKDPETAIFYSPVSIWESYIKRASGKLKAPKGFYTKVTDQEFRELPITAHHTAVAGMLPNIHQDPFDRLLIAQAHLENLTLITADKIIPKYKTKYLEA